MNQGENKEALRTGVKQRHGRKRELLGNLGKLGKPSSGKWGSHVKGRGGVAG